MAEHKVAKGEKGVREQTLVANQLDTVVFEDDLQIVEIISDGTASIFVTVDALPPTLGGGADDYLPAFPCVRNVVSPKDGGTAVRLISAGTPTYSVAKPST